MAKQADSDAACQPSAQDESTPRQSEIRGLLVVPAAGRNRASHRPPPPRLIPVPDDLELTRQGVFDAGPLVECDSLPSGAEAFDAGWASGRVMGDLGAGCEARSDRSVLVDGNLSGAPGRPCTVKAQQQVVVNGGAAHAQITAGSIHVAGDADACCLVAATAVHVGGDLSACEVTIGGFEDHRHALEVMQTQASRVSQEHQLQAQRLAIEERRVNRLVKATRVSCEVQLGQLIRVVGDRVRVDLQAFYRVVGPRPVEALDAALLDFFNRAVSGRMALANRGYLRSNPANQKVFMRVLGALRQLFVSTRQADTSDTRHRELREQIHQAARALRDRPLGLHLNGAVRPDLLLTFVVPDLTVQADGSVVLSASSTRLQVAADPEPGYLLLRQVGANGAERELTTPRDELRTVSFWRDQGVVNWRPMVAANR